MSEGRKYITANLEDVFMYQNTLVKVVAINPGKKAIIMERLDNKKCCNNCGQELEDQQFSQIESSPNFQNAVTPVKSIS